MVLGVFCRRIAGLMLAILSSCTFVSRAEGMNRVAELMSVVLKGKVQQHVDY